MAALVTVPNVELVKVGTWRPNTTDGRPWVVTPEDIADAVRASQNGSFRTPIVKLGHADPAFTEGKDKMFGRDGKPAVGRVVNQRASADGCSLRGDLQGVPKWLAEVMASAYPGRSVDALLGAVAADGQVYRLVITHLALLGETVPAIESLEDVAALYGHDDTDVTDWLAASSVAATLRPVPAPAPATEEIPVPEKVSAARVETVMAAAEQAAKAASVGSDVWCREILADRVVYVNARGQVWTATWDEKDGNVTIGTPVPASVSYSPLAASPTALAAHALHTPVSYGRLSPGLGSEAHRSLGDTSVSIAPALRAAVGMEDSADEAAVEAAILAKLTAPVVEPAPTVTEAAVTPPAPIIENTAPVTPVIPAAQNVEGSSSLEAAVVDVQPDLARQVAAAVSAALPAAVSAHMAPLAASNAALRTDLGRVTTELAAAKRSEAEKVRDAVVSGAISAGKIRPADRERFLKLYDKAPVETVEHIESIAAHSVVPMVAAGYAGEEAVRTDEDAEFERVFGWEATS